MCAAEIIQGLQYRASKSSHAPEKPELVGCVNFINSAALPVNLSCKYYNFRLSNTSGTSMTIDVKRSLKLSHLRGSPSKDGSESFGS